MKTILPPNSRHELVRGYDQDVIIEESIFRPRGNEVSGELVSREDGRLEWGRLHFTRYFITPDFWLCIFRDKGRLSYLKSLEILPYFSWGEDVRELGAITEGWSLEEAPFRPCEPPEPTTDDEYGEYDSGIERPRPPTPIPIVQSAERWWYFIYPKNPKLGLKEGCSPSPTSCSPPPYKWFIQLYVKPYYPLSRFHTRYYANEFYPKKPIYDILPEAIDIEFVVDERGELDIRYTDYMQLLYSADAFEERVKQCDYIKVVDYMYYMPYLYSSIAPTETDRICAYTPPEPFQLFPAKFPLELWTEKYICIMTTNFYPFCINRQYWDFVIRLQHWNPQNPNYRV